MDEFEFPSDFGFTSSSTPTKMHRGGMNDLRDEESRVIGVQDNAADEMRRVEDRRANDAKERKDKRAQVARVGSRERNARDEMTRLRGEAKDGFRNPPDSKGRPTRTPRPEVEVEPRGTQVKRVNPTPPRQRPADLEFPRSTYKRRNTKR
tara:strand:- start:65 stop:514 length:450 start_codon:yes stop_codon:yes gene_type:complete